MKEADLFRQYAKEAMRWSSSKSASADERRALIDLACRFPVTGRDAFNSPVRTMPVLPRAMRGFFCAGPCVPARL